MPIVDEAKETGDFNLCCSERDEEEAGLVDGIYVIGLSHLREVMRGKSYWKISSEEICFASASALSGLF